MSAIIARVRLCETSIFFYNQIVNKEVNTLVLFLVFRCVMSNILVFRWVMYKKINIYKIFEKNKLYLFQFSSCLHSHALLPKL